MSTPALQAARARYTETGVRWGFIWALWCAILWGAWYVPGYALFFEEPFAAASATTGGLLKTAAAITTLNAIFVLLAMFVWMAALNKIGEYRRTLGQARRQHPRRRVGESSRGQRHHDAHRARRIGLRGRGERGGGERCREKQLSHPR
jgi:hypothetical protein